MATMLQLLIRRNGTNLSLPCQLMLWILRNVCYNWIKNSGINDDDDKIEYGNFIDEIEHLGSALQETHHLLCQLQDFLTAAKDY